MTRVRLVVLGEPLPMPRPRVTAHGTYSGGREHRQAKERIRAAAQLERVPFMAGPVQMDVDFFLSTDGVTFWKRGSGDIENLFKLVADALEGVAYANDSQIISSTLRKHPATDGRPRMEIVIEGTPGERPQPKPKRAGREKAVPVPAVYRRTR